MDLNEYQTACKRTALYKKCNVGGQAIAYCALAMAGEAGEVANLIKKAVRTEGFEDAFYLLSAQPNCQGPDNVSEKLREELGDVLWYLAALAHEAGMTLEDVAQFNLGKLAKRHADGIAWTKPA